MIEANGINTLFVIQLIAILLMLWATVLNRKKHEIKDVFDDFTVLIPFRNEEKRIRTLIQSFNESKLRENQSLEIIFIDDHSSDLTAQIIRQELNLQHQILKLEKNIGKKWAIDKGVESSVNKKILTLDADVSFDELYLQNILDLDLQDLMILPVEMKANSTIEYLGVIEFNWLKAITYTGLAIKDPKLCNGANLLFSKKAYLDVRNHRVDFDIESGDDIFLLDAMKKANMKIEGSSSDNFKVVTPAPSSMKKLLIQRKRWISKMTQKLDLLTIIGGLFVVLVQFGLFYAIYSSFYDLSFLVPVVLKLLGEYTIQIFFGDKKNETKLLFYTILHQLWYPIYMLMLLIPFKDNSRWSRVKVRKKVEGYRK